MEYRRLGKSGLKVSEIGLGTNNFGARADEKTSLNVINHALEIGINFIDTSNTYGDGRSEELIGQAIKGKRNQVIVATKFGLPRTVGPDEQAGSRSHMIKAIDASLKRLKTDYIDLYYFHHPDPETPIEETLRSMDDLVRSGKVRYIGCSNFTAWQLCEALWTSRFNHLESFIVIQSRYNLIDRGIEQELIPCCQAYGVSVIPWGPLADGFLTGKYHRDKGLPSGTRLNNPSPIYQKILTEANFDKLALLETFARERGHDTGELAIAWLLAHPWVGSVIPGAMNNEQLSANVVAANWKMNPKDISELENALGQ